MKPKIQLHQRLMIGLLLVMLGLAGWPASMVLAGTGLPDRNPPPPAKESDDDPGGPPGSILELSAPAHPGAESVVQWQAANGDWQNVDGWRGELDSQGERRWWVAAKDFGSGPFRWVVGDSAQPTAVSEPFRLPAVGAAILRVPISAKAE